LGRVRARFAELGASLLPGSPADFGKLLADETEKWVSDAVDGSSTGT
jgi:hypothetical protein